MVEQSYLPDYAILCVKFSINVAKNVQMHSIYVLYRETQSVGGKEPRQGISCEFTTPKQKAFTESGSIPILPLSVNAFCLGVVCFRSS